MALEPLADDDDLLDVEREAHRDRERVVVVVEPDRRRPRGARGPGGGVFGHVDLARVRVSELERFLSDSSESGREEEGFGGAR